MTCSGSHLYKFYRFLLTLFISSKMLYKNGNNCPEFSKFLIKRGSKW
jgi:hypothetical protein